MIIVSGASGLLGRAVLTSLLDRVPAERIGASVRDPAKLSDLQERGVRVRHGDFADLATLASAFEGASSVLVVSVNELGADAVRNHRNAITAAVAAGAQHVRYTSHLGANPSSGCPPMVDHANTEAALRASGIGFTALRNGFYASTVPMLLRGALATGELRVPEDGAVAWTAHADLAEATARILADGAPVDTVRLTGPTAVTMAELAAIATELTGRTIRHAVVPDQEYRDGLVAAGTPAHYADLLTSMFVASRHGDFGSADPTLASLLDRPATSIEDYLRDALATVG